MPLKYLSLDDALYVYVKRHHSHARDPLLADLRRETEALGDRAAMQIGEEQGTLLGLLVAATGSKRALEIGTFTGMSSLCIARGLPAGGTLLCLDVSEEWTSVARRYWARAGLADRIELRLGPAAEALRAMPAEPAFDFAFIDADKTGYDTYFELVLPRLRPNGLIVFDNMLYGGRIDTACTPESEALNQLNRKLAEDPRVESVLIGVADGLMISRKR